MPDFDFKGAPADKTRAVLTYTVFSSDASEASPDQPILILNNSTHQWPHHAYGIFTNPSHRTSFEFDGENGIESADILKIDARFVSLLKWLGANRIPVRLSGENREGGYAVYRIREKAFGGGSKLSAEDGFLQYMIERLFSSPAPKTTEENLDA